MHREVWSESQGGIESRKPAALSPSRRVFFLVAYLRYDRGDRVVGQTNPVCPFFKPRQFLKLGTGKNACPTLLEARPRSPLRWRAPSASDNREGCRFS
jgi:hypothetical protein